MTTSKSCSKCEKGKASFFCVGCEAYFCKRDYEDHRAKMTNELDGFIEVQNKLQEKMNTMTLNNHVPSVLLTEIDDWEKTTIEKVKNIAEQTRQQLIKLPNSKKEETESRFEKFCQDFISLQQTGDFVEHDLKHLQQTIDQLNQDLKRLTEPFDIELCTEQSNQIQWDTLIYIKEKLTDTERLQQQVNEQNQTVGLVVLDCHGRACPKCKKCCDWENHVTRYDATGYRVKRSDATCYRAGIGPGHMNYCDCVGHCCCGYDGYNYHPYSDMCCCAENK